MATIDYKALAAALAPQLKDELLPAIIEALNADDETKSTRKGGFRKHNNDYAPEEGIVNIREYSELCTAVYGDLKGKTELLDCIKSFGRGKTTDGKGNERDRTATFMTSMPSIEDKPAGWCLYTEVLNANGGISALKTTLEEQGMTVIVLDSVKEKTAELRAARKENKSKDTTASAPATPTPATPAPAPAPAKPATIKAHCYEPIKEDPYYALKERDLIKQGDLYIYQAAKGNAIYINAGKDGQYGYDVFALIAKTKDEVLNTINPKTKEWSDIAKAGILKSIKAGKLKPTVALMWAVSRYSSDEDIKYIWNLLTA